MEVYAQVQSVLDQTESVLGKIEDYKGCQSLARQAMTTPSHENEKAAFEGLLECVDSIATFFQFAKELEKTFSTLLLALADHSMELDSQQGLCTQIAQLFDFCLRFDQTRMMRPNLSNDFSYYRRLLPKFNKHPDIKIKDDDASGMALFTAEHIPMNNRLTKAGLAAAERDPQVTQVLTTLTMSCATMIKSKKFDSERTNLLCARAMAGAMVLFDHVDAFGSFSKRCPIHVKMCVQILKREFGPADYNPLLNAIRFSTKNFNDGPASLQAMFD